MSPRPQVLALTVAVAALSSCGRGGVPTLDSTKPTTAAQLSDVDLCRLYDYECGPVGDGFGRVVQCGTCPAPTTCGGAGAHGRCGGDPKPCAVVTCDQLGLGCGPQGDGCGDQMYCGSCKPGDKCGIGGPSVCGTAAPCEHLCLQQTTCTPGVTTTITGRVVAPTPPAFGAADPIFDTLVYVPNGDVQPFSPGVACEQCGAEVSGDPLVLTHSGADGTFTLSNVPVGSAIPLVIQIGRWRRRVTVDVAPCMENSLPTEKTRLPRNHAEGDIPLMAMVTGSADPLECILRKIGIDNAEFTPPDGPGRVRMYVANGATMTGAPDASTLWGSKAALAQHDLVVFACEGKQAEKPTAAQQAVIDYANHGGRVLTSHFSYTWLYDDAPFAGTGTWMPNTKPGPGATSFTGIVDTSFARGKAFAEWLDVVSASTFPGSGKVEIDVAREDLVAVHAPGQRWIYTSAPDPATVQHYTFDTPVDADDSARCGRVVFSDFHVTAKTAGGQGGPGGPSKKVFPQECDDKPLSPQERVLEYMLFDLSSCVSGKGGACTPLTCASLGYDCGPAGDGCGGLLDCGKCAQGKSCGLGGKPSVCGAPPSPCVPLSCGDLGFHCGPGGDGCGGLLDCGACGSGKTCGGGGLGGVCGP